MDLEVNENVTERLWDFAVTTYASPQVGEACLTLQDEQGVDVPMLLFALWLAANNITLSKSSLISIDRRISEWREQVIWPLRDLRRRLKSGPYPAPSEETEQLRQAVKAAELRAERAELAVLEAEGRLLPAHPAPVGETTRENAMLVVRHYGASELGPSSRAAIDVLTKATPR